MGWGLHARDPLYQSLPPTIKSALRSKLHPSGVKEEMDFVDPAMASLMLVAGGEAVIPSVAEAVAVARQRSIFVVWCCAWEQDTLKFLLVLLSVLLVSVLKIVL